MLWIMDNWNIHQIITRMLSRMYPLKDMIVATTSTKRVMKL